jgi:Terminase large subunit, T4likevirus-type, N-terminal/Terminase RNaseH-like domain
MNIATKLKHYLGNPNLKRINMQLNLTEEEVREYVKCSQDPTHFIENYVKIISLDKGFIKIKLYPFQKDAIEKINDNRKIIVKAGRQVGKTTMVVGYILWYILFNEEKFVAILANKASTAREILSRVKIAYEALPLWLQQGVRTWNKGDIELENNCRVMATSTASSAIRGFSISLLYLDEFAFVPSNIADDFFTSVYPTISSGTTSKILISSTPNGMNHFYKMWTEAIENLNGFTTIEANWRQVPGRDQKWADDQKSVLGEEKFLQEMECEFMGSSGTLLSAAGLKSLAFVKPVHLSESGIKIYQEPISNHNYMLIADTSRGKGLDYSAYLVIDTTVIPYRVVSTYKDNNISPLVYPSIIKRICEYYNQAYALIEINDNGQQVADSLFEDYDYENILSTVEIKGKIAVTWGYGNKSYRGIRTTKSVKRLGCSIMKNLIESQKVIIQDFDLIAELSTFIAKGTSFEAEEGSHDDLVMCLVLFSWMTNQQFFSELTNTDVKTRMHQEQMKQIEEEQLPTFLAGHLDIDEAQKGFVENGVFWNIVER